MPAGEVLTNTVFGLLDIRTGKTIPEIGQGVSLASLNSTASAVRYAVANLIKDGKAVKRGRQVFALTDISVDIVEGENKGATGIPLSQCFPDDGYLEAKADLIRNGVHRGGGGAAPAFELKLSEAAV